jgi:hypothetical protein
MSDDFTVRVVKFPKCAIRGCRAESHFDGKTKMGDWATMCDKHFLEFGIGVGSGKGNRLTLDSKSSV